MESKIKILNNITNFGRISEPNLDMNELSAIGTKNEGGKV